MCQHHLFFQKGKYFKIYLFLAVLGPCCSSGFSLVGGDWGLLSSVRHRLLIAEASHIGEQGLSICGEQA